MAGVILLAGQGVWAALDGRLNAPTGAANFPNLLDGYAARPPWFVAGVDYRVGINTGVTLKNPATDTLPTNCTRDVGNKFFNVNGNTTVDGWDFSLDGGWQLLIFAGDNVIVTNNDFSGALCFVRAEGTCTGATFRYNIFNGAAEDTQAIFTIFRPGIYIYEYNWWSQCWGIGLQTTNGDPGQSNYVRYNIFQDCGRGDDFGAHGDWMQTFGQNQIDEVVVDFNLCYQDIGGGAATQGISLSANDPEYHIGSVSNNTMVILTNTNRAVLLSDHYVEGPFVVNQNYVDMTGLIAEFLFIDPVAGPFPGGAITDTGNINMVTGGAIT